MTGGSTTAARAGTNRAATVRTAFIGSGRRFIFALMIGADFCAIFGLPADDFGAIAFFTSFGDDPFLFDDLATETLITLGHPDYKTKEQQVYATITFSVKLTRPPSVRQNSGS
jgi:hypothetical protein